MSTDYQQLVSVALYHVLPAVRSLAKIPAWRTPAGQTLMNGAMPSMRFLPVTMLHRSRDIVSCQHFRVYSLPCLWLVERVVAVSPFRVCCRSV